MARIKLCVSFLVMAGSGKSTCALSLAQILKENAIKSQYIRQRTLIL